MWSKIPAKWKMELISVWHTFLAAFVIEMGVQWQMNDQLSFSIPFIQSILFAAFRSGIKAVFSQMYAIGQSFTPKKKVLD